MLRLKFQAVPLTKPWCDLKFNAQLEVTTFLKEWFTQNKNLPSGQDLDTFVSSLAQIWSSLALQHLLTRVLWITCGLL